MKIKLIILIIFLIGCSDGSSPLSNIFNSMPAKDYIYLGIDNPDSIADFNFNTSYSVSDFDSSFDEYTADGYVQRNNIDNYCIYVGIMTMADRQYEYSTNYNHDGHYGYRFEFRKNLLPEQIPNFGTYGKWGISGNPDYNLDSFYIYDFYSPEKIRFQNPDTYDITYYKYNDTVKIEWNKDTNNTRGVWIMFSNEGMALTNPKYIPYYYYFNVPDIGYYVLDLKKLNFPIHDQFMLVIVRNNERLIRRNNFKYYFRAVTYDIQILEFK